MYETNDPGHHSILNSANNNGGPEVTRIVSFKNQFPSYLYKILHIGMTDLPASL